MHPATGRARATRDLGRGRAADHFKFQRFLFYSTVLVTHELIPDFKLHVPVLYVVFEY